VMQNRTQDRRTLIIWWKKQLDWSSDAYNITGKNWRWSSYRWSLGPEQLKSFLHSAWKLSSVDLKEPGQTCFSLFAAEMYF
jgi:hypothetical protein